MAKEKMDKVDKKEESLSSTLFYKREHIADTNPENTKAAFVFCEEYKRFLDKGKTERECASTIVGMLKEAGYKKWKANGKYKAGDKVYMVNRGKAVIAATLGSKPVEDGTRLVIAHIDSPRIDLKPNPLYEAERMAFFKTHYYGGVRKYQWVATPLSMHGVVVKTDGTEVDIHLGEKEGEPVFTITDLLPHLSQEQNKRPLSEGIKGEELNILVGAMPYEDKEESDRVRLETMRLLNKKYGIVERDFMRAEIEFVPAAKSSDVGFDRSMVGGYGQDDRVCAFTALKAEIDGKKPTYTTICVLTDKEETGSDGNTGLASDYMFHFLEELAEMQKANYRTMLRASYCLSADVGAAYDPTFSSVFDKRNSVMLNEGMAITKYHGARGKAGTSDASAELMGFVTNLFDKAEIAWQTGELGKVDMGGGGTIAKFVANRNVEVVDVGVPVLSMHSPFEVTSKLDIYNAYRAFSTFIMDKR